ncbi:MAG TPA: molybdopterin-guanine dinucleotide biosynthesis protein MobB [Synergistales bacterium]|jgi:molybdopterin-guanine dinucleotide biosynthesis protein B|nr:molybdopterin-guanine dinucleotide biosynthesis protein MobB [Synergistaceae bacterium]HOO86522.1 molybdopterin-guanine dinucleotide biosynthesis protein MobB [Synergistales bacterium]HPE65666.1 molybdopterin-guanine dinucleotide biosynthesis protein MobB [Synergistales bacterium]
MPLLIAVSGFKDSGKTSLARALLTELSGRGLSLAFMKHTDRDVLSPAGTDTGGIESQGIPCAYWGNDGLRMELPAAAPNSDTIAALFPEKDIVIVEGAKSISMPRIWVGSAESAPPEVKGVFACFDRAAEKGDGRFLYVPGEENELADRIAAFHERFANVRCVRVAVRGKRLPLKPFVAEMIRGSIAGLLLPLKGIDSLKEGADIHLARSE